MMISIGTDESRKRSYYNAVSVSAINILKGQYKKTSMDFLYDGINLFVNCHFDLKLGPGPSHQR